MPISQRSTRFAFNLIHPRAAPILIPEPGGLAACRTNQEAIHCCTPDDGYCSPVYKTSEEFGHLLLAMTGNTMETLPKSEPQSPAAKRVYKLVLTGGPCGGKTTGQERLATFFENLGWKVFTVPETATVLLGGGVKFQELTPQQTYEFQKDLLKTLIRIEDVFFNQAALINDRNVLVICDRGAMDPSAYIDDKGWNQMLSECNVDQFSLREDRYNQICHLVTAADGAENFYTLSNNNTRKEGIDAAKKQDDLTRQVWIGHPYVDIIDNSNCKSFDDKILKLIEVVCSRIGIPTGDRLHKNSKKRKWLVRSLDLLDFPKTEEFKVTHDYLLSDDPAIQIRIRSRMQNNRTTYTITSRHFLNGETVETRMKISEREYQRYLTMKDRSRATIHKQRRCFTYGNRYFNLDVYVEPLPPAAHGPVIILETYTTNEGDSTLPPFLEISKEITGNPQYSMYELSKRPSVPSASFQGDSESRIFSDD
ncbi:unnamed protein product, partial [Mesorhabditis belari]|uniref:NadR/Ttd14 AAA domain-containing protein n=1 Tax=Mesorhabditis belari TaxID=2138241 RepID=A0AAF3EKN8_9BILA